MAKILGRLFTALTSLLAFITLSLDMVSRTHVKRRHAFAHIVAILVIIIIILIILIILTI